MRFLKNFIFLAFILTNYGLNYVCAGSVLMKPSGVAVDKDNFVYILDGKGICRYSPQGKFINTLNEKTYNITAVSGTKDIVVGKWIGRKIKNSDISDFAKYFRVNPTLEQVIRKVFYPEHIIIEPNGKIYAIGKDIYHQVGIIGIIDPEDGHTIATYRIMSVEEAKSLYPRGIAVDNDGNIYITNFKDHPVKKFTKDGKFIRGIGKRGKGKGEFMWPWGIAVDKRNGDIYVTDVYAPRAKEFERSNLCVQKFNKDGKFLKRWGGELVKLNSWFPPRIGFLGDNTIEFAEGIAVDSKGYVYVLEKFGPRVSKFNASGGLVKRWGKKGTGPGEFDSPEGICVDKNDNIYVADTGNDRVQKFDPNGKFLMEIQ